MAEASVLSAQVGGSRGVVQQGTGRVGLASEMRQVRQAATASIGVM